MNSTLEKTVTLHYADGAIAQLPVGKPTYRGMRASPAALWVMHHTVVLLCGLEDPFEAWDDRHGLPTHTDLARIEEIFGAEARAQVEGLFFRPGARGKP